MTSRVRRMEWSGPGLIGHSAAAQGRPWNERQRPRGRRRRGDGRTAGAPTRCGAIGLSRTLPVLPGQQFVGVAVFTNVSVLP